MILEALCRGNYSPPDLIIPSDSECWKTNRQAEQIMDLLKSQISDSHYKLVEQLVDKVYNAQCFECEAYYKLGFATGMAIAAETQELLRQNSL